MSVRCMAEVWARYPVGGGEMMLALALADIARDDGAHIYPSVSTMAEKVRQSVRAVQVHLRAMQAREFLYLVKAASGRGRPSEYRINPAWLKGAELAPIPARVEGQEMGAEAAPIDDPKRVQISAQKGADSGAPYKNRKNHQSPPNPPPGGEREGRIAPTRGEEPGTPGGFDTIAAVYPRRSRIEAARPVFDQLAPDARLLADMLAGIRAWKASTEWQREGGRYIPKLRDFLRDERWRDAPGAGGPVVAVPVSQAPDMTPEQLRRNAENARAAVARVKGALRREVVSA